jgi:predicted nucleotidyltransferase component of viral defense system
MECFNIEKWVKQSPNTKETAFREAVHTILLAISNSQELRPKMIFHGGLLLALRYKSIRHTVDIDFATACKRSDIDEQRFIGELGQSLLDSSNILPYGLDCRIQSHRINPPGEERNYPTLEIRVGYAYKGTKDHRHLMRNNCSTVVSIDYSFNEFNQNIDIVKLQDGMNIEVYSLPDLIAEKYRSIIQQKERKRSRRQDPFDIYGMLQKGFLANEDLKEKILESLQKKSLSRNLIVDQSSLSDAETIRRSKQHYHNLASEIEGDLPLFEDVYKIVKEYYESLPWI